MAMKTILVPLGDPGEGKALLDAALAVARRFDGHIRALYVQRNPADSMNLAITDTWRVSEDMKRSVIEAAQRGVDAAIAEARGWFEDYCRSNQVPVVERPPAPSGASTSWRSMLGQESVVVAHLGRLADLILVRRPADSSTAPETLEAALMETGRPLLILPPAGLPSRFGSRIAIGWNGSAEAAAAVFAALPFLAAAESVEVLTTGDGAVGATAEDLVQYLAWNGIAASVHAFDPGSQSTGMALLSSANSLGADLLVLGGYGHSRARETIFGGVTRDVLAASEIPLLMAH